MGKTKEFRDYAARLVVEERKKITDVAYQLEVPSKSLSRWVRDYRKENNPEREEEIYMTPGELKKMKEQHEKELKKAREEIEILKKAMSIVTKNQT